MTGSVNVPPSLTETTAPFWEGLERGELLVFQCRDCRTSYWPYAACRECENEPYLANMRWVAASGGARILSFNLHEVALSPNFPAPYVYALLELDEGPVIMGNIEVDWESENPKEFRIGDRVEAVFVRVANSHTVLSFARVSGEF